MSNATWSAAFDKPAENALKKYILAFQLGYGMITLCLMIYIFILLANSPKYTNSFYRLVQVDLVTNIICWCNTWISVRSLDLEIGIKYLKFLEKWIPGIWNCSAFLTNFFFHMQFCSATSMSIHRISAILFFLKYDKFWRRWFLLVDFLFIVYSILPQLGGLPTETSLINGTLILTTNYEIWFSSSKRLAIFAVVYFLILVVIGITVARIAFKKLQDAGQDVSRKLSKIALTYGIVYSGILVWTILYYIETALGVIPPYLVDIGNTLMSGASDMITLSLPYILIIFDSNIKRDLRHPLEAPIVIPVVAHTIT